MKHARRATLVVALAVCLLWLRSMWRFDQLNADWGCHIAQIDSCLGAVKVIWHRDRAGHYPLAVRYDSAAMTDAPSAPVSGIFSVTTDAAGNRLVLIAVPHWLIATLLIVPTAVSALRARRKQPKGPGFPLEQTE